jgi:hypothetical protein
MNYFSSSFCLHSECLPKSTAKTRTNPNMMETKKKKQLARLWPEIVRMPRPRLTRGAISKGCILKTVDWQRVV